MPCFPRGLGVWLLNFHAIRNQLLLNGGGRDLVPSTATLLKTENAGLPCDVGQGKDSTAPLYRGSWRFPRPDAPSGSEEGTEPVSVARTPAPVLLPETAMMHVLMLLYSFPQGP